MRVPHRKCKLSGKTSSQVHIKPTATSYLLLRHYTTKLEIIYIYLNVYISLYLLLKHMLVHSTIERDLTRLEAIEASILCKQLHKNTAMVQWPGVN